MIAIKLKSPKPRNKEIPYEEFKYSTLETIYLPVPVEFPSKSYFEVVENRRTNRNFDPISIHKLSSFLWLTSRTRERKREDSGYVWQHRNVPSAGGRHPIDIFISGIESDYDRVWLYNPLSHSISQLQIDMLKFQKLIKIIGKIIPIQNSAIIWLVAQVGRTLSKYEHGESLIWRDSGVLLANYYLSAEFLNLNCCGLGITGDPWISKAISGEGTLMGVGGCLLGEKNGY